MCLGVAKVDQQTIAEILGDVACVLPDDRGRRLLVGTHHRTQVFRVELARELCGAYQVAEEHGELPPFRCLRTAVHERLLRVGCLGRVLPRPDEPLIVLLARQLAEKQLVPHGV